MQNNNSLNRSKTLGHTNRIDVESKKLIESTKHPGAWEVPLRYCNLDQLSKEEQKELRAFYWASFFGIKKFIRLMIVERRWSPFIKSFKKRSILAAAIIGGRSKTCRIIICDYVYPED